VYPLANGGGLRLTTARWYTPAGRSISRPIPKPIEERDVEEEEISPEDTVRPRFSTDAGRTVYGGGGITPDVVVGDTVTPLPVLMLARAMGSHFGEYREALSQLATSLHKRGAVRSTQEPVTRDMLATLYADLQRRNVAPNRDIFNSAGPWIARSLGYEMTRVAFGVDAEFQRRAQEDASLQRAARILAGSRTPREVFARLEQKRSVEVPASSSVHPADSIKPR
jgi:carboxyl-terminal processing protease